MRILPYPYPGEEVRVQPYPSPDEEAHIQPYPYSSGGGISIATKREPDGEVQILPYFPGDGIYQRDPQTARYTPAPTRLFRPLPMTWKLPGFSKRGLESRYTPPVLSRHPQVPAPAKRSRRIEMMPMIQYFSPQRAL